jgi:hypothetical protein
LPTQEQASAVAAGRAGRKVMSVTKRRTRRISTTVAGPTLDVKIRFGFVSNKPVAAATLRRILLYGLREAPLKRFGVVVLGCIAATPLSGVGQDPIVTSARVSVDLRATPGVAVWIENQRDVPLVAWDIGFVRSGRLTGFFRSDQSLSTSTHPPGRGPIPPGERREIQIQIGAGDSIPELRLTAALFADGSFAGAAASLRALFDRHEAQATEFAYWIDVFARMPRSPQSEAFAFLRRHIAERSRAIPRREFDLSGRIESWIGTSRPDSWTFRPADAFREDLEEQLAAATRHRPWVSRLGLGSMTVEHVTIEGVAIQGAARTEQEPVAYLENLRDVPLEAWTLAIDDDGGLGSDACMATDEPGRGRIQPGERREIQIRRDPSGAHPLPRVVISGAWWADGHSEGRPPQESWFGASRAARRLAWDSWIPLFREAASMPSGDAIAFLKAKDEERARQFPREQSSASQSIEQWTKAPPDDTATLLRQYADFLERQRAQCGR